MPTVTDTVSSPTIETPHEKVAWVNPSRCVTPCTYDPSASLVRVDMQGARIQRDAISSIARSKNHCVRS